MTSDKRYLVETKLHSLLTPERKFLDTRKTGNVVPFRSPVTNMKQSATTSLNSSRRDNYLSSPYQKPLQSYLDFTPVESRNRTITFSNDNQFYLRTARRANQHQKLQKTLKTNQTFSEQNQQLSRYQQLQKLKKENEELKRRLSLKTQCNCQAPYVQQEVQYLRHHFHQHIQKYHQQEQIKK